MKSEMEELFNNHADAEGMMSFEGFAGAYNDAEPGVPEDRVATAWWFCDQNEDKMMSKREFMRCIKLNEGPPERDNAKVTWYWNLFASDKDGGMTFPEYSKAVKIETPQATDEEIKDMFGKIDVDGDGKLSRSEWANIMHNAFEGKDLSEWWQMYSSAASDTEKGLTYEEYAAGYRAQKPDVSEDEINIGWWMSDVNQNGRMCWTEFQRMMSFEGLAQMEDGPMKSKAYWDTFSGPEHLMNFKQFRQGALLENGDKPTEMIHMWFDNADKDATGTLTCREFQWLMNQGKEEEKEMSVGEMYGRLASNPVEGLTGEEFYMGWMSKDFCASEEEMRGWWWMANGEKDRMNLHALQRMMEMMAIPHMENEMDKMGAYYHYFTNEGEEMTWDQFNRGRMIEYHDAPEEEMHAMFAHADHDGSGTLSMDEFMSMGQEEEHHEGSDSDSDGHHDDDHHDDEEWHGEEEWNEMGEHLGDMMDSMGEHFEGFLQEPEGDAEGN